MPKSHTGFRAMCDRIIVGTGQAPNVQLCFIVSIFRSGNPTTLFTAVYRAPGSAAPSLSVSRASFIVSDSQHFYMPSLFLLLFSLDSELTTPFTAVYRDPESIVSIAHFNREALIFRMIVHSCERLYREPLTVSSLDIFNCT
jgi:hypothetical protein